ncbi:glycosyl hydrolase [Paenibacillaceae bacterium]|nr:glycosyl hydrolase [Paenibacillaceae bacterium]
MNSKQQFEPTQWAEHVWQSITNKIDLTSHRIGDSFPYVSLDGKFNNEEADWWTNGFWPGLLWLIYRETGNERLREIAESVEAQMDEPLQQFYPLHHDVGFMWSLTSVANYKLTGNERSKQRALTAASHLAGRYNPKGKFIRAWNQPERIGWAIIDCMMNLPLLYWASEETGDPRFKHIAREHADMTLRDFQRPDGSTCHIVCFDPESGERLHSLGGQGYGPDSAWSRGTAWSLYGMALSYRYTKQPAYLEVAERNARFFLNQLPEDKVPLWDFRAPKDMADALDSSASVIAASGMLELSSLIKAEDSTRAVFYYEAAVKILQSVYNNYGAWDDPKEEGLIMKTTANRPRNAYINVPNIYADYFFAEAIGKLRGKVNLFW